MPVIVGLAWLIVTGSEARTVTPHPSRVLYALDSPSGSGWFVWQVVEDRDGDGLDDLWLVSADSRGRVKGRVHRGMDGQVVLETLHDPAPLDVYYAFDPGDADGDGVQDLAVVGGSAGRDAVVVLDGADGSLLARLDVSDLTAFSLRTMGDVDGDGAAELLARSDEGGKEWAFCLRTSDRAELWRVPLADRSRAEIIGDVNGDEVRDVALLLPYDETTHHVRVVSGADGTTLWDRSNSCEAGIGSGFRTDRDRDGDGALELLIPCKNRRWIVCGRTGETLGEAVTGIDDPFFDVDGDGEDESLFVHAWRRRLGPLERVTLVASVHSRTTRRRVELGSSLGPRWMRLDSNVHRAVSYNHHHGIPEVVLDAGNRIYVVSGAELTRAP